MTNAQDEAVAENFAKGYYTCTATNLNVFLTLGIGTNNSVGNVNTAAGKVWGSVTNTVKSYVNSSGYSGQVTVLGANDIEPGYATYDDTLAWEQGFVQTFSGLYIDNGSTDGCSQTSSADNSCNNGWTTYRVYNLAWKLAPATVVPQIYYTSQSNQWYEIALYGSQTYSSPIKFQGPMDEHPGDTSTFTYTQAWTTFSDKLDSNSATSQTMPFDLEIQPQ